MMFSFFKKNSQLLETEVAGITFRNPLGADTPKERRTGFITLTPPKEHILDWIAQLQDFRGETVLAVNINNQIIRSFSLVYDFADLIIVDPDSDAGIDAADLYETHVLLDEIVSLRLCYEHYTPVFLRLSHGLTHDEIQSLLSTCQLCGVDGIAVSGLRLLAEVREITRGRLPLIAVADNAEEALQALSAGASLVETHLRGPALFKLLKTLENQASQTK